MCSLCGVDVLKVKQLKQAMSLTTDAYEKACEKIGFSNFGSRCAFLDDVITREEYEHRVEGLDEVYREILCKLPSDVLQNIVTANKTKQQRRAQKTIDTIVIELLEREIYHEEERGI